MSECKMTLEQMVAFCKRKGFVYQSSEIYGGFSAVYDYGPYGIELKNNIAKAWWKALVYKRRDVVGLDSAIFMDPRAWIASGHVASFHDPLIECRDCNQRMRADTVLEKFGIDADRAPVAEINEELSKLASDGRLKCDKCGSGNFTEAKVFNLLVKSNLGSPVGDLSEKDAVYLRGETCQGIYLNFKNVMDTMRKKIPFGIAQIGKAFRNEIVARQFIMRTREFEQMEFQYFVRNLEDAHKYFEYWREQRINWYRDVLGLDMERVRVQPHKRFAHYAKAAEDIEYDFPMLGGHKELEGIHLRGGDDYDLGAHQKFSGTSLEVADEETGEKFIPYIVETAAGLNRLVFAMIESCYEEEEVEGEIRTVLRFKPEFAPVKVAILPLQKKPEGLVDFATELWELLAENWHCEMDLTGSIGKRYRRQDEIGTPFCVTVDFDSIGEGDKSLEDTVTVRERDSMKQERVAVKELPAWLREHGLM